MVKKGRKKIRKCESCRNLKIKCDGALPACEYCRYTNRRCVYLHVPCQSIIVKQHNHDFSLQSNKTSLNSKLKHLQISRFESRILDYFFKGCLNRTRNPSAPNHTTYLIWEKELPKLILQSDILKNCILSISCMYLETSTSVDMEAIFWDDMTTCKQKNELLDIYPGKWSHNILEERKNNLNLKSVEYFLSLIKLINLKVKTILSGQPIRGQTEAAIMYFSETMLFMILAMHPGSLISVLSNSKGITDLISITRGMAHVLRSSFQYLRTPNFNALFLDSVIPVDFNKRTYPLIQHLKDFMRTESLGLTDRQFRIYLYSINELEKCFHWITEWNAPLSIMKWVFILPDDYYVILRSSNNYYALKLLYYYSSLIVLFKICFPKRNSIWKDFIRKYEQYNIKRFSGWKDLEDESAYALVNADFNFERIDLSTFLPSLYISSTNTLKPHS